MNHSSGSDLQDQKPSRRDQFRAILNQPEIIAWRSLLDAQKAVFSVLESSLQKRGFTLPRFQIMFYLYFDGPMAPAAIANRLTVSRSNITAFLRRLMADDIVKPVNSSSEGKRPKYDLTAKGKSEFEEIFPTHTKMIEMLIPGFSDETLQQLQKIRDNAMENR